MKNIIFIFIVLATLACKAQKPVQEINTKQVRALGITYNLKHTITDLGNEYVQVENALNKFSNVKQVTPKVNFNMNFNAYTVYDKNIITKICAEAIPLENLKKMATDQYKNLSIEIKYNSDGYPIEFSFLIKKPALIIADEIAKIEKGIKKSPFRITFRKEIQKYTVGANYFSNDFRIKYTDMLKFKLGS